MADSKQNNSEKMKSHAIKTHHGQWMSEEYEPGLVSVVIPTYNRADLVGRAIQSVLDQTYRNFEIIVIDDASTDDTQHVVESFTDKRIRFIKHHENSGGPAARNSGIRAARGEYVAFLDSDDEWLPNKLDKQIALFEESSPSVGVVYCLDYGRNDDTGRVVWQMSSEEMRRGDLYSSFLSGWCPAITSSVVVLAPVLKEAGMFDESLPSFEDYDLWLRITKSYEFDFVEEPLVVVHKHSRSRFSTDLEAHAEGLECILKKWASTMENVVGSNAAEQFRTTCLSAAYNRAMWRSLVAGQRLKGLKYFFLLRRFARMPARRIVKIFAFTIGGTWLVDKSRIVWETAGRTAGSLLRVVRNWCRQHV